MTPLLRKALLLLLVLAPALSAPAKDVRFPETGVPAYAFILPDDWISRADNSGNLIMANAARSASFVILVGASEQELDEIAKDALTTAKGVAYTRKEPAEISGHKGFTYFSSLKNAQGVEIGIEMTIVRVSPTHISSASLLLWPTVAKADETAARILKASIKLVTE